MSSQSQSKIGLAIVILAGIVFIFAAYQAYVGFNDAHEYRNVFHYRQSSSSDRAVVARHNKKGTTFSIIAVISGIVLIYGFQKLKNEEQ
ncbi:MAG: hypothetical protein K9H48_19450 [Melioribacteraceae bacterium]|nr:hypothetical protein [Melioribacteraceae bacterium]